MDSSIVENYALSHMLKQTNFELRKLVLNLIDLPNLNLIQIVRKLA